MQAEDGTQCHFISLYSYQAVTSYFELFSLTLLLSERLVFSDAFLKFSCYKQQLILPVCFE